jgi:hypothetical protein
MTLQGRDGIPWWFAIGIAVCLIIILIVAYFA